MAQRVPGWIERPLLPRLSSIEGELKGLRGDVEGEFKAIHSENRRLDEKIGSFRNEALTKFDSLEKRFDFAKEFGILQAKVTELEARLPKA
jgi:hypothetical protein